MLIIKRDGTPAPFEVQKITDALNRCYAAMGVSPPIATDDIATAVSIKLRRADIIGPHVEQIQSMIDITLRDIGENDAADVFLRYRMKRTAQRTGRIPRAVTAAFEESANYFPTPLQQFQFFDKYSRFDHALGRRETWIETVDRTVNFLRELSGDRLPTADYARIRQGILTMDVMPSMRLLAMAGDAARRNNISLYNCSYLPVDSIDAFVEALIISMSGCGVGYSVEARYVAQLPMIQYQNGAVFHMTIADTVEGWADALRAGLTAWFWGNDIAYDYSQIRPAGAILKTKGGRASGPQPLMDMLAFCKARITARAGARLTTLDCHDMMCSVGSAAVSGGVRRTAMISLFDFDDTAMWHCKDGDFEHENSQRWNANNSAVWPRDITARDVLRHMLTMDVGGRGEAGIFSRDNAQRNRPARRANAEFGVNPCAEIVLRPMQFCNLSAVVTAANDTIETLKTKVEIATIIGTIQSMATNFQGLRPQWQANCEEERLLGVDITGQMDCLVVQDATVLAKLKQVAIDTNKVYAQRLGINQSVAVTTCKPSGNTSQLVNCASGIHARWARYYIRNVRVSAHSPLYHVLRDANMPLHPENGQTAESATTWVASFPIASPTAAIVRAGRSALAQCDYWLLNKVNWTEHNPSVTITYRPEELIDLVHWVWTHRELIGGMAFLPASDAQYAQMPYIEITREDYLELAATFPVIKFAAMWHYEKTDMTTAAQELACSAGLCEI